MNLGYYFIVAVVYITGAVYTSKKEHHKCKYEMVHSEIKTDSSEYVPTYRLNENDSIVRIK